MRYPNIKTYIVSVLKPHLKAIADKYSSIVKEITNISHSQLNHIYVIEAKVVELARSVANLTKTTLDLHEKTNEVIDNQPNMSEVRKLERRVKELDYITSRLYDKYWELIRNGHVEDPFVPEFKDTWIPGDPVLSNEELEVLWRKENGIELDEELTPHQVVALDKYIVAYREHHPSS